MIWVSEGLRGLRTEDRGLHWMPSAPIIGGPPRDATGASTASALGWIKRTFAVVEPSRAFCRAPGRNLSEYHCQQRFFRYY